MIEIKNLTYQYQNQTTLEFPDVLLEADQSCLVLGNSGVGKTTFLHLVGGLMRPKTGTIDIDGKDITKMSGRKLDLYRGQQIGIIFQKNHFVSALSVIDNMLLAQKLAGSHTDKNFCLRLLDQLNIKQYGQKLCSSLSEGEKQRVSIARSLVNKPALVLADEPTSALDDENCTAVIQLLKQQTEEIDASLIIVTHDNRLKEFVDKRIVLEKITHA